jgi:hypothetical protein
MKYQSFFIGDIAREDFIFVYFIFNILCKYFLEYFSVDLFSGKLFFGNI